MGFFAALVIYLPKKEELDGQYKLYFGIPVSEASVEHEVFSNSRLSLEQLNGVRILNSDTGKYTYYFEYIANKQDTLRAISALPFLKDNTALTQEERDGTSFFWNARAEDFTFYECYKSPVKHTILLSKTSDRILHKVEFM